MGVPLELMAIDDLSDILADWYHYGFRFLISVTDWKVYSNRYWQSFKSSGHTWQVLKVRWRWVSFSERAVRFVFPSSKSRECATRNYWCVFNCKSDVLIELEVECGEI
jgi:hypothetical protein